MSHSQRSPLAVSLRMSVQASLWCCCPSNHVWWRSCPSQYSLSFQCCEVVTSIPKILRWQLPGPTHTKHTRCYCKSASKREIKGLQYMHRRTASSQRGLQNLWCKVICCNLYEWINNNLQHLRLQNKISSRACSLSPYQIKYTRWAWQSVMSK